VWTFLRRRKASQPVTLVDDGTFEVVAESFDPASSDVGVLDEAERAGVDLGRPLILRHFVEVPAASSNLAKQRLAADGYEAHESASDRASAGVQMLQLQADRTVSANGLLVAQERTRVAGLVARLGGDVHGWQLLAPRAGDRGRAGYDRDDP